MKYANSLACLFALIFIVSGITTPPAAQAQTMVDSSVNVDEILASARLRSFNGDVQGAFLGVPDLGIGDNRVETNLQWADTNDLTWSLDSAQNRLVLTVDNEHGSWSLNYDDWRDQVAEITSGQYSQADLNVLKLEITNRDDNQNALITLSDIELNGQPMGNFSGEPWQSPPHERRWIVGDCFGTAAGFELSATLELDGLITGHDELNRVSLSAGVDPSLGLNCAQPADLHIAVNPSNVTLFRGQETVVGVMLVNLGDGPGRETTVKMIEPEDLTMTDALAACEGDAESGITACPLGDIDGEGDFYFEFTIRANEDAPFGPKQFQVELDTSSLNLNPDTTATINVNVVPSEDRVFRDRFEPASAE